jgi:hypothetical protein
MDNLDPQAVLLMYLADELPSDQRAAVAQALEKDAALRAQLEDLRQLEEQAFGALSMADVVDSRPAADEAHVRRVVRELRRQQVELAARPAPTTAPTLRRHWPRWAYPAAAVAAAIFIVLGLFAAGVIEVPIRSKPIAEPGISTSADELAARELTRSFEGIKPTAIEENASVRLDDVEARIQALREDPF